LFTTQNPGGKMIKKLILCAALSFGTPCIANTYLSDISDLWWNANESGWGVTVLHQREVVFLTFFVYGADGRGSWYTAQGSFVNANPQGAYVFTGTMYQINGPWFGTTFNPAAVNARAVGNMTFTAFLDSATLSYTIDGVAVNRALTRFMVRNNTLTGEYVGAIKQTYSGCTPASNNGDFNVISDFSVTNTSNTFSMSVRGQGGAVCNYNGNYTQTGRLDNSIGTYACSNGVVGNYQAFEIEANISGLVGRYAASNSYCTSISGRFAAMKK
jgi:hypothetical protein